jgi:hypothetical protein
MYQRVDNVLGGSGAGDHLGYPININNTIFVFFTAIYNFSMSGVIDI